MAPLCGIIPEYVLEGIIEKGLAPQHTIHRCQFTLKKTKQLQDVRERHRQSIAAAQPQQTSQGIIPPYILETLARNATTEQKREAASHILAYSTKHRTVAGRIHQLSRTVYDTQNSQTDLTNNVNKCYDGLGKTYDFYFNFFQRNSFNNNGIKLDGFVHTRDLYNAFYNGEELVFGDGDGVIFDGFTDKLDVIGHEFSHSVVDYTNRLPYQFQSGALNESFVDAFGIMTVDQANWLIGEGIWAAGVNGRALRDIKNPRTAFEDAQRDFKKLPLSNDQGGVHINSGIPNRAFFLAATKIGGYAWEGAGPIWYRALSSLKLPTNGKATFKEFADLTIESAGEHVDKVQEAWTAVRYPFPEKRHEL
ncbi:Peptidase M4 [Penicillium desertorum]|uniref:Peptidase M4 n=1 Tax=Penicillium desertorum TaxID=1303715 RepID=A0A9X0BLI6_9EURO|nr:Peptidase M4 [Penicillium desertorum]